MFLEHGGLEIPIHDTNKVNANGSTIMIHGTIEARSTGPHANIFTLMRANHSHSHSHARGAEKGIVYSEWRNGYVSVMIKKKGLKGLM